MSKAILISFGPKVLTILFAPTSSVQLYALVLSQSTSNFVCLYQHQRLAAFVATLQQTTNLIGQSLTMQCWPRPRSQPEITFMTFYRKASGSIRMIQCLLQGLTLKILKSVSKSSLASSSQAGGVCPFKSQTTPIGPYTV